MDWKTEQEWIVIRYFKDSFPRFPQGKLVKGESPDFRLWISTRKFIGIELTQVHPPKTIDSEQSLLYQEHGITQINTTIRAKEEKIPLYRSDYPFQLWLIIFADYSEPQAFAKVSGEFQDKKTGSSFDQVFLFDLDTRLTLQLK